MCGGGGHDGHPAKTKQNQKGEKIKDLYHVQAHSSIGEIEEDFEVTDLYELAQFVRETFAYMNGCHDTSDVDVSWINFTYDLVEDEDGEDITAEAKKCK